VGVQKLPMIDYLGFYILIHLFTPWNEFDGYICALIQLIARKLHESECTGVQIFRLFISLVVFKRISCRCRVRPRHIQCDKGTPRPTKRNRRRAKSMKLQLYINQFKQSQKILIGSKLHASKRSWQETKVSACGSYQHCTQTGYSLFRSVEQIKRGWQDMVIIES
jgi:hypothetical protein